jgi:L-ascorbate metabolism protein UlaG (beta-lactamase superfamily)
VAPQLIEPLLSDDALLADIDAGARAFVNDSSRLSLWWLGQSGFLLQWRGRHALLDPYLSDSLTRKYAATDKPHVRMTRRPLDPARMSFVDVITSSHGHTDHLDGETLTAVMQASSQSMLVHAAADQQLAAERTPGVAEQRRLGVDAGHSVECRPFQLHAVPAAHETLERDAEGRHRFLGYVLQAGPWTVYHSGDTVRYEGLSQQLAEWDIDVAILPINGRRPERRVAGNLWGDEAAQLAHDIRATIAVPCHFEMFEFNTESPQLFLDTAQRLSQRARLLRCGERLSLEK